jgi:hypothetical protein
MSKKKAVVGVVNSRVDASLVVDALENAGVSRSQISALLPDDAGTRSFAVEKNTKAPEAAVVGATTGGAIGGTLGLLAGIGSLAIPGLGPLIAAGPILAALSGGAAGAAIGGLAGALVGLGIPEIEATLYENKIRAGGVLLAVHVDDDEERDRAREALKRAGATDIGVAGEHSASSARREDRTAERH